MRFSLLATAALCAAPVVAACDLNSASTTIPQPVTVAGYVGKGVFSDSVATNAPFQLIVADSSGQNGGELVMAGDVVPPTGTYDLDTGTFPAGLSSLSVEFLHPMSGGTSQLYQPSTGNMVITSIAGDSIAGNLAFAMVLTGSCAGPQGSLNCVPASGNGRLTLSGTFVARRAPGVNFPAP